MLLVLYAFLSFQFQLMAEAGYSNQLTNVSFQSLKHLLDTNDAHTIADLLPLLPESYRSRYALMFKSRSLHASSYAAPRVILYGSDAKFILTFNGNPDQKGFEALETMEYDEEAKKFLFREILFSENSKTNSKTTISEANPKKCASCHGDPARPIWDTYPNWPGAYGERNRMPMGPEENTGFQGFLKSQPTHPRYRSLTGIREIADQNTFKHNAGKKYDGTEKPQPNAELNSFLSLLNYQWIMGELKKNQRFPFFKYALLAALDNQCDSFDSMLPNQVKTSFKKTLDAFSKDADYLNNGQELAKKERLHAKNAPDIDQTSQKIATRFRYLVEEGLGISTLHWSLAFEKGSSDFTSADLDIRDLEPYLKEEIATSDEKINHLYPSTLHADHFCSYLRKQSLLALKDLPKQVTAPEPVLIAHSSKVARQPQLLAACIACHESGVAPAIEFSKPMKLAHQLLTKKYPRGVLLDEIMFRLSPSAGLNRMPLNQIISVSEELELKDYFQKLSLDSSRQ